MVCLFTPSFCWVLVAPSHQGMCSWNSMYKSAVWDCLFIDTSVMYTMNEGDMRSVVPHTDESVVGLCMTLLCVMCHMLTAGCGCTTWWVGRCQSSCASVVSCLSTGQVLTGNVWLCYSRLRAPAVTLHTPSYRTVYLLLASHRLRGSASTVLTATSQVNGRWRILTPNRIQTHEPTATKFRTIDYVRGRTP